MSEQVNWPSWWNWEVELSGHLLRRMLDRQFSETDLRTMLDAASGFSRDVEPGRWLILTKLHGKRWEIVLEPDEHLQRLVVITAYMVE